MGEWWQGLSGFNQALYAAATFFSVFFVWQLIAAFVGLDGDADADADVDADVDVDAEIEADADGTYDDFEHGAEADSAETITSFRLVSVRSVLAFCTLFSWAGAMYMSRGYSTQSSLLYGLIWGGAAMVIVALIFHLMRRMAETGTPQLATCVGRNGTVYLDIPEGGRGEVRVPVSGVMAHVKARTADGKSLSMGKSVRVRRVLDSATVEVESV